MKIQNIHCQAIVFILLVAILPANSVKAQSEFGVKGGALYTGLIKNYNSATFDYESKNGVSIGAFYRVNNLFGPINFQTELLYQLKGAKTYFLYSGSSSYGTYYGYGYNPYGYGGYSGYGAYGYISSETAPYIRNKENYHYFNVPLLLSVTTFRFFDFYAGPELGYLFATSKNSKSLADLNKFSMGISTGIAIKLGENTRLDLRYSRDFTKVSDLGSIELKNQGFAFTVQQTLFRK